MYKGIDNQVQRQYYEVSLNDAEYNKRSNVGVSRSELVSPRLLAHLMDIRLTLWDGFLTPG